MIRCLLLIAFATLLGTIARGAEIAFRDEARPAEGGLVRLGDVADVRGADARRLAELPLMPKPAPGTGQSISAQAVREMLAAQGVASADHRFTGAYFVRVGTPAPSQSGGFPDAAPRTPDRASPRSSTGFRVRTGFSGSVAQAPAGPRRLTSRDRRNVAATVRAAVQREIDQRNTASDSGTRLLVRSVELSESGTRDLAVMLDQPLTVALPTTVTPTAGPISVRVWPEARRGGEAFRVVAQLAIQPMRVVAAAATQRNSLVTASMVRREPVPLDELDRPGSVGYAELADVVGRETTRPLRTGDVLSESNTAPPLMVERGEEVTVSSGGGGVSVSVYAVAQQDGRQGELVSVETVDQGEKFMARVVGPRRLAILSAGPSGAGFTRTGGLR